MRDGFSVTAIIPALNEEAALPGVLAAIPPWVDQRIVVDNGSTDRTAEVATLAGATVVSEPRRGYGRACLAGLASTASGADVLVFLDADGSDDPRQMDRLLDPIIAGQADLVIGSRMLGRREAGSMTTPQRLGNVLAPAIIRWLWGARFSDLGPFRAIRAESLRRLSMDDQTYGWTVQMQVRAARLGLRCTEVPVDHARRRSGQSKISGTVRGVLGAATTILSCISREYLSGRRPRPAAGSIAVFTRLPRAGFAKTRLIPAVGPDGAAKLHVQMIRHTLVQVIRCRRERELEASVWLAGEPAGDGDAAIFHPLACRPQVEGDLGARLDAAFREMLRTSGAAVIIGTDCPELSPGVLHAAFEALATHDVVIGPASDGGYYLIGLQRPVPALFRGMPWGEGDVTAETGRRAEELGLHLHLLPVLDDVDVSGDLSHWIAVRDSTARHDGPGRVPELSVIIPTLNEAERIAGTIDHLRAVASDRIELIVADGGSTDGTRRIAMEHGARTTIACLPASRGAQMNAGASLARGRQLLFLHADTYLLPEWRSIVDRALSDERTAVCAFSFRLDMRMVTHSPARLALHLVEIAVRLRCALFRVPYGDQALAMRVETFRALGGFAPIPLLEDVELIRRAKARWGRRSIRIAPQPAVTSPRRWTNTGVLRMTAINQLCLLGFAVGMSPRRLAASRSRHSADRRAVQPLLQNVSLAGAPTKSMAGQVPGESGTASPVASD